MTGLTLRLQDRAHVAGEVDALRRARRGWRGGLGRWGTRVRTTGEKQADG